MDIQRSGVGRGDRREVTRYQSFQPLSCLVTTGTIRPATTLCTAQGSLTQGSAEQHFAQHRDHQHRDQWNNTLHSSSGITKTGIKWITLCTAAHGTLKQGFLDRTWDNTKTRGSLVSESVDNCLECLQDVWQYGCEVFSLHWFSLTVLFLHVLNFYWVLFSVLNSYVSQQICAYLGH